MMSKIKLMGALGALTVVGVMGQSSCVQLNATDFSSCPCEDATLTFTLEGETTVAANTVNLAIVLDGSGSINSTNFSLEQGFAEDTVAAFAARNLFDNGGTASYVQYSSVLASSGTFTSAQDFNDFAVADVQSGGGTTTSIGIDEGTALLAVNPASASFMIVITDGQSSSTTVTTAAADAARAEGIVVFAVGVGDEVGGDELLGIAGDAANVFLVEEFDLLDAALESILSSSGGTTISCPSTGATVTIEFNVPVASTASGSVSGSTVTFSAADLEANATVFEVLLEVCGAVPGGSVVISADYTDDQGNTPDLSVITGLVVGNDSCPSYTPVPTPSPSKMSTVPTPHPTKLSTEPTPTPSKTSTVPTPHPTKVSTLPTPTPTKMSPEPTPYPTKMSPVPTPCPKKKIPEPTPCPTKMVSAPTPCPTKQDPKRGKHLKCGAADHSRYLGCYLDEPQRRSLDGPMYSSEHMTTQMCAERCSGYEYFGTAYSSDCHCGDSKPTHKGGLCDYECSGDSSKACGGVACMSVFEFDYYGGH